MPEATTPGVWIVNDDRQELAPALARASARAASRDWKSGTLDDRATDLRFLGVQTCLAMNALQGPGYAVTSGQTTIRTFERPDHQDIADALSNTFTVLATKEPGAIELAQRLTSGKSKRIEWTPLGVTEIQGPQWVVIAIVCTAWAAGVAAVAYFGGQVVDRQLSRSEDSARMLARHQWLLDESAKQIAEEKAAGKSLPVPEIRKQIVAGLLADQKTAAAKVETPGIGPTFDLGLAVPIGAAALLAYFLLKLPPTHTPPGDKTSCVDLLLELHEEPRDPPWRHSEELPRHSSTRTAFRGSITSRKTGG